MSNLNIRPKLLPIAEPVKTIGASAPTEPPKPIVMAEATIDDQVRALAKKGGVAHITMYQGFLKKGSEATVMDAIAHLEHAINIMGIDHVGIGTDFDGDGTVRGMADASEMINFTLHLLRRKYSERDIERIWGGNWLRVMAQVQSVRK